MTADAAVEGGVKAEGITEVATAVEVDEAVEMATGGGEKEGIAAEEAVGMATLSIPRIPTLSQVSADHRPYRSHSSPSEAAECLLFDQRRYCRIRLRSSTPLFSARFCAIISGPREMLCSMR